MEVGVDDFHGTLYVSEFSMQILQKTKFCVCNVT